MTQLVGRSTEIDAPVDLNDAAGANGLLFVRDGVGVAGRGEATMADSTTVAAALRDIRMIEGSFPPVAIGALPFSPEAPGRFVVPRVSVVRTHDGSSHLVVVGDEASVSATDTDRLCSDLFDKPHTPPPNTAEYSVGAITAVDDYLAAVVAARDAVRRGEITKAVIARDIRVTASTAIDIEAVMHRLKLSFGSSYRYRFGNLVGASPELLVEVDDSIVRSNPLAGTTARTGDPATDEKLAAALLSSEKNQIEHRVVVDMVHDTLLPFCSYLDWEPEASIVPVANVQHLGTRVEGKLGTETHVVELARLLCPTPALGGYPRDAAIDLIRRVEGMDRGLYGGGVGWCDANGNGTFAVTIRCAEFSEDHRSARLFAGGGIVAESDPHSELAETQAKFQAMLSAIIRP
jgi:menaquinone-specific isochorismate synthase